MYVMHNTYSHAFFVYQFAFYPQGFGVAISYSIYSIVYCVCVRECVRVFSCWVDVYKILIRLCILEQKWKYVFFSSSSPVMVSLPRGTLKLHTQYSVSREKY